MLENRKNNCLGRSKFPRAGFIRFRSLTVLGILALLIAGCSSNVVYPEACPSSKHVGLAKADPFANDNTLPFRFPLDENIPMSWFGRSNECTPDVVGGCFEYPERKYHAAEDYDRPAGTPVYAMADGVISFSGTAGGYGWLILIDHPQANIYSLYGHLSPSRWKLKAGTNVERGDLIGYLGDPDENGGSKQDPLITHLHFGIRAGQTFDYPSKGEWRYMGGWIKLCPQDVGWLQPSLVIINQDIPDEGFTQPDVEFLTRWGFELIYSSMFMIFGANMITRVSKQENRFIVLFPGIFIIVAGFVLNSKGLVRGYILASVGLLILAIGIYFFIRKSNPKPNS